jgi:diketogulonate reductase-like aldo/keto reductase
LLPWCRGHDMPIWAYSPLGCAGPAGGRLRGDRALRAVAERHSATTAQIALAWILRQPDVVAIPKAGNTEHVRENAGALEIALDDDDLRELDAAFPPPRRKTTLEMI